MDDLDQFIAEQRERDPAFREAYDLEALTELERIYGYQIDAILPDGTHRYWSTHCRHGRHDDCSAREISGRNVQDREGWSATIERKPAQCKTCSAAVPMPLRTREEREPRIIMPRYTGPQTDPHVAWTVVEVLVRCR